VARSRSGRRQKLKRFRSLRGSVVYGVCSYFRLLAETGRWRFDRADQSGCGWIGQCGLAQGSRILSERALGTAQGIVLGPLLSSSELGCRRKAFRDVDSRRLSRVDGGSVLGSSEACRPVRSLSGNDETSEATRNDDRVGTIRPRQPSATSQSGLRRREPRSSSTRRGETREVAVGTDCTGARL
jgi:hypothetical protein